LRDSYIRFFSEGHITKEQFFDFGLKETIYAPLERAEKEWEELKNNILCNKTVYIRGFGRDAKGTHLFLDLYKQLLNIDNVKKDSTNNAEPTKIIKNLTGYSKTENRKFEYIRNYQVSHVFGRTKNVYAFTAPWNIVYTPKLLDPFTGHEAKGEMIDEYTLMFQQQGYKRFSRLIEDFNRIITNKTFKEKLSDYLQELADDKSFNLKDIEKLQKAVTDEFKPIEVKA